MVSAWRGLPKIMPHVTTLKTPGYTVDVVVAKAGATINPAYRDVSDRLAKAGLPILSLEDLAAKARSAATKIVAPRTQGSVVAVSEYRDGTVIDNIRRIDEA